jgi:uncharacterized membrane protein
MGNVMLVIVCSGLIFSIIFMIYLVKNIHDEDEEAKLKERELMKE